jgi:uncharacterized membrane protein
MQGGAACLLSRNVELMYLSGVFEVAFGLAVLFQIVRQRAGYGLVALRIAVFPANLNMALNPKPFLEQGMTTLALHGRLPFRFVFMVWAIWSIRPDDKSVDSMP